MASFLKRDKIVQIFCFSILIIKILIEKKVRFEGFKIRAIENIL